MWRDADGGRRDPDHEINPGDELRELLHGRYDQHGGAGTAR